MEGLGGPFLVAAALLGAAGVVKLRSPVAASAALASVGWPAGLGLVRALGATEVMLSVGAVVFGGRAPGAAVAAAYLGFSVFITVAMVRGAASCGCFGDSPPSAIHLAWNIAAAGVATAVALWGVPGVGSLVQRPAVAAAMAIWVVVGGYLSYVVLKMLPRTMWVLSPRGVPPVRSRSPGLLVDAGGSFLASRVSRRSFIVRATMVGAALTVAPFELILRPVGAYAAICGCAGQDCDCGALCCDGYTEFCCTMFGGNSCPPGSIAAGWWKADGSGLCGPDGARYYIDCNTDVGSFYPCKCGNDDCGNRKSACTQFRYGQCNTDVAAVGPIVCRVVTCTPPWLWDPSCGTTLATDNFTRFHNAACLSGSAPAGAVVSGDWTGDGVASAGIYSAGIWYLKNLNIVGNADVTFEFGNPGDIPVAGDWNGDGVTGVGVFRRGIWFLRDSPSPGPPDRVVAFGDPGDLPVTGDWNGDGITGIGVVRQDVWHLRNSPAAGPADATFPFGNAGDLPVTGDWNGDGVTGIGVVRRGLWHLRDEPSAGPTNRRFVFGNPGDAPLAGDWNGDGVSGPAVVRGGSWFIRNQPSAGNADVEFAFGADGNESALAAVGGRR